MYARIGGEAFGVLAPFLAFATSFVKDKAHNMLALGLDSIFKELICITKFIGRHRVKLLVQEYDRKKLLPMLMKATKYMNLYVA